MAALLRVFHAQNSPLTVDELVQFLDDLNVCHASLVAFFNIDSKESADTEIAELTSSRLYPYSVVAEPRPFDELSVARININSPGWLEFFGAIRPFQFLIELYKEYNSHQQWKTENRIIEERSALELEMLRIEVLEKKIEVLRKHDVSEDVIQRLVMSLVARPSGKLLAQNPTFSITEMPKDII